MFFEQKIFLNNKPLVLTNSAQQYNTLHPISAGYLSLKGAFPRNFNIAFKHIEKKWNLGAVIEDISIEELQQNLIHLFPEVHAAGGVVRNEDDNILMIFRRGKWDLPKGKLDDGESLEDCAIREVKEETGLSDIKLGKKLTESYHIFSRDGKQFLKVTHWYGMKADKSQTLTPQFEENILDVKWIDKRQMNICLLASYEAIKEVLTASQDIK